MNANDYQPPVVYFGGKSAVADEIWNRVGDVANYVEPFFGSGAVLFLRPGGAAGIETVNDADGMLANFWRSLQRDPDAVADAADNPVNEADLHARHLWLVGQRERITDRLCGDPDFYDAQAAGWWVWGINCWIGSGWCSGAGPWIARDGVMVREKGSGGGVKRKLPHLGDAGKGVNRQLPHLGNAGTGECAERREWLRQYLRGFADRLRGVRVCCGDWSRVCGPSVTGKGGVTGVFLAPPYGDAAGRDMNIYAKDCGDVAGLARDWAIEQGENPEMRIVLAGYEGEHEMPKSWRRHEWKAHGGYAMQGDGAGRENSTRERLWFSPHCIAPAPGLFDGMA